MTSDSSFITIATSVDDTAETEKAICKLCRRQFAKYTCPTCNVPYCSLMCFRSEAHSQCSEPFYKKELESGIRGEPSKSIEERNQMLSLLKRFEEESTLEEDEEDEETELQRRLGSVDLEAVSPDDLWSLLTPAEQQKFLKAVNDPSSDLAQELLSREELTFSEPWWTSLDDKSAYPSSEMDIPPALLKPTTNQPLLAYNMAAIGIVYAFIVRHLGVTSLSSLDPTSEDFKEAHRLLCHHLPFLVDRKSTLVFPNLDSVITSLASRFDERTIADTLAVLLQDASQLMRPLDITDLGTSSPSSSNTLMSHPHQLAAFVLADISHCFKSRLQKGPGVTHKLIFYAAHVITMPTPLLRGLAQELQLKSSRVREQGRKDGHVSAQKVQPSQSTERIEVLGGKK